jgi:AraC-like DNA-binding protein
MPARRQTARPLENDRRFPGGDLLERRALGAREGLAVGHLDKTGVRDDQLAHTPEAYSLVVVLTGHGSYIDHAGTAHRLYPGCAFERVPGRQQTTLLDPTTPWRERFLAFGPLLSAALIANGIIHPASGPVWTAPRGASERLARLHSELKAAGESALPKLQADAIALLVALRPAPPAPPADELTALRQQLLDDPLGRHDLAAWCARRKIDPDRIRKAFQRRYGLSVTAFRLARRMERACTLLRHGGHTAAEIADLLGYNSAAAFATQFRRHFGQPPARWRTGA